MIPIIHIRNMQYNGVTDQLEIDIFWFVDSSNWGNAVTVKIKPASLDKVGLDAELQNAIKAAIQTKATGGKTVDDFSKQ